MFVSFFLHKKIQTLSVVTNITPQENLWFFFVFILFYIFPYSQCALRRKKNSTTKPAVCEKNKKKKYCWYLGSTLQAHWIKWITLSVRLSNLHDGQHKQPGKPISTTTMKTAFNAKLITQFSQMAMRFQVWIFLFYFFSQNVRLFLWRKERQVRWMDTVTPSAKKGNPHYSWWCLLYHEEKPNRHLEPRHLLKWYVFEPHFSWFIGVIVVFVLHLA